MHRVALREWVIHWRIRSYVIIAHVTRKGLMNQLGFDAGFVVDVAGWDAWD